MKFIRFFPYIKIVLGLLLLAYLIKEALGNGDFKVFLEASKMVVAGEVPYNLWIFVSEGNFGQYYYSPFWATFLIPFTYLPSFIPHFIWLLASCWFVFRSWKILKGMVGQNQLSERQWNWIAFITILLTARFALLNFGMIQMTPFLMWGGLESLHLFEKKKHLKGGLLLALVINVKTLPLVLIPYLLYRGKWKAAGSTLAFSCVLLLLPALVLGWSANLNLHAEWWNAINPSNSDHLIETSPGTYSISAWIPNLLSETESDFGVKRNILNLKRETAVAISNGFKLALILLTLFFLKWPPFKAGGSKIHEFRVIAFLFLVIPLVFPHQQKYAYFLILPAAVYLSYWLFSQPKTRRWKGVCTLLALSFLLMTLSTDGVIGKQLYHYAQHFKTITIGALLLVAASFIARPSGTLALAR